MSGLVTISRSRTPEEALIRFLKFSSARPDIRWKVTFDGYDDDDREIWDIERCAEICRVFEQAGVLGCMAVDTAWLFYRVSHGLFVPGTCYSVYTDDHIDAFIAKYEPEGELG